MSELRNTIAQDVKSAMRAKDKARLGVLRMLQAALKQIEVDERRDLSDQDVIATLTKQVKQREESLRQYADAGREDLAEVEAFEAKVLKDYLPSALTESELLELIEQAMSETGASNMKGMGQVMNWLRPKVQGRTDMGALSAVIKRKLTS